MIVCINIQNTRIDTLWSVKHKSSWLWTKYLVSSVLIFWFHSIVKETNKLAWQRPEPLGISKVKVAQLCSTFCYPTDCSPPGSSVCRILQPRILEWVAVPSSLGSSQPRNQTQISRIAVRFFSIWASRKAQV